MRAARLLTATLALSVATVSLLPITVRAQQPAPAAASAAPAPAPPRVPVRSGVHSDYSRLVFDWPRQVPYTVEQNGAAVSIRFPVAAQIDPGRGAAGPAQPY